MKPSGPFNLLNQNQYFNGWPTLSDNQTIVMAFPIEDWSGSAAVTLHQQENGLLDITVHGTKEVDQAKQQALACMSLDEDGARWPAVGERDSFIASLQQKYKYMRPTLFHSPYEAAAGFLIGHRISIPQARKIRVRMAEELGDKITMAGESFYAFPSPQKLLTIKDLKGLNNTKIDRLHAVAQAALAGKLDREYLRNLEEEVALSELEALPGIGPFFSQGILYRGAGKKDGFTQDDMTHHAIKAAYNLSENASSDEILAVAENWRPYRMWATVLLHVWLRETNNFPKRTFSN